MGRLQRADQYSAGGAFLFADKVHAPVDAVGTVDVKNTRWAEHHPVARRRPIEGVRRRLGVVIGFDFGDDSANTVHQQRRADQLGRHMVDAAGEKFARQQTSTRPDFSHQWKTSVKRLEFILFRNDLVQGQS